ncbi:MAG: MBL fold metallo-hydrolase, partial [bacterium]
MFHYDKGIKINGAALWLDAERRVEFCCVSHAHLDHARKHDLVIATEQTVTFLKQRLGKSKTVTLRYEEPYEFDGCKITLFPAGHILGSAQTLVETNGARLLYSGDFNMDDNVAAEPIKIPQSDVLIMECTFGKPQYRFPPRKQTEKKLVEFVSETLKQHAVPVVIGYVLGKSQEAMKILGEAGFEMSVHGSIARLAETYERYGIQLGRWHRYHKDEIAGKVL